MRIKARLYLDSCCFIDLVKEQTGRLPPDAGRVRDVWFLKQLIKAHVKGDVLLQTSYLTVAEAVAVEAGEGAVSIDVQDRFRRLLTSGQFVSLLAPTPRTATIAQDLRWKHGLVLAGPDCIHIASALEAGCVEFLTTDGRILKPKLAAQLPKLKQIGLSLVSASRTTCLPDEYRQGDMLA